MYFLNFVGCIFITVQSLFISDELETNEYATMSIIDSGSSPWKNFKNRVGKVCENIREPIVLKFYLFLFLKGLEPDFGTFNYYFVTKEIGIS